jgi:excisionase family DNA binding protein
VGERGAVDRSRIPFSAQTTSNITSATVNQAAELLGTTVRFPRRLVAERRVRYIHVGRHVRIPLSALEDLIRDGPVEPVGVPTQQR